MAFLPKDETASLISIKLTDKGREFLANGFKTDNVFDIVKFSFGDSEIDYTQIESGEAYILAQDVMEPTNKAVDIKSKIYASGVEPSGVASLSLSTSNVSMTTWQSGVQVSVTTQWPPVDGVYFEDYSWVNLGPLEDYDFGMSISQDTRTMTLRSFDTVGTTTIRVKGMISGKYELLTLTIS